MNVLHSLKLQKVGVGLTNLESKTSQGVYIIIAMV